MEFTGILRTTILALLLTVSVVAQTITPQRDAIVSSGNSTTVALAAGDTFTGKWEKRTYPEVGTVVYADEAGKFFYDFSPDTTIFWSSFPVDGYDIAQRVNEFHTAVKLYFRWFRVRMVNTSATNQDTLIIHTEYGKNLRQGNAPIGQSINDDSDAINVKSVIVGKDPSGSYLNIGTDALGNLMVSDFLIAVAKGDYTNLSKVHKFGANDAVGTSFEDVPLLIVTGKQRP